MPLARISHSSASAPPSTLPTTSAPSATTPTPTVADGDALATVKVDGRGHAALVDVTVAN